MIYVNQLGSVVWCILAVTQGIAGFDKAEWIRNASTHEPENSHSYLDWPRIHFSGTFWFDSPTGNNLCENYDIKTFDERFRDDPSILGWNPEGSGCFQLLDCKVTSVCYTNGDCSTHRRTDRLIGTPVFSNVDRPEAKIADIDTAYIAVPTIFGLSLHVPGAFSGKFVEAPMSNSYHKTSKREHSGHLGADFYSLLVDVDWYEEDESHSHLVKEMREMSFQSEVKNVLSVKFNLDNFEAFSKSGKFGTGRIVGSIGVAGPAEPLHGLRHRQMHPPSSNKRFGIANFRLFPTRGKILIDLGNSLPYNEQGFPDPDVTQTVQLAYPLYQPTQPLNCDTEIVILDEINYTSSLWYEDTAGIITVPSTTTLTFNQIKEVSDRPLFIRQLNNISHECEMIVLSERLDGLAVGFMGDRVFRQDPGDSWNVNAFLVKFGHPFKGIPLEIETAKSVKKKHMYSRCGKGLHVPFNQPPTAVHFTDVANSNQNGIAVFEFVGYNPDNPREIIDGQIYLYEISVHGQDTLTSSLPIVIFLYNSFEVSPGGPTWHRDIYPIFKMYSNMFPSMNNIIDMASYEDVCRKIWMLKMTMTLSMNDPEFMPVTRDLSRRKQRAIVQWLDDPKLGDIPKPSLDDLKRDLQTALELELSTIPPYLTAWLSIKKGYNKAISNIIRSIATEEMLHMAMVANILRSICGTPILNEKKHVPTYPSRLPGGVHPHLTVSLGRLTKGLIEDVFMKIEEPDDTLPIKLRQRVLSSVQDIEFDTDSETPLRHHNRTIGQFYYKRIWKALSYHASINSSLFACGDETTQVTEEDWYSKALEKPFAITSIEDARRAIELITEQGEGSSPTQPYDSDGNLSHYFKFMEVVMGYRLVVDPNLIHSTHEDDTSSIDSCEVAYSEKYTRRFCDNGSTPCHFMHVHRRCNVPFHFTGERVPLHDDGIWPIIDNPSSERYPKGSKVELLSDLFNKEYSNLLRCIHDAFNGNPRGMRKCMSIMARMESLGRQLVKTPIDLNGDPNVGPNGAPTFEFKELAMKQSKIHIFDKKEVSSLKDDTFHD
ncbi:uncharacterized protein [Ptychodera flava]|uniref:uncharacterized protein n=1 Tax=Ptychodera flava TaxID=63121 RepID=UPI00396A35C7